MQKTLIAAVTALAGSLLFWPPMLVSAPAANALDFKTAITATHNDLVLVRGGGGGFGGGHMGGWGGGHMMGGPRMGGGWSGPHHMAGWGGPRVGHFGWHEGGFHRFDNFHHFDHFHHRFVNNRFIFVGGGWWPYYGYGSDCWWLRREALITGSPYWWHRYQVCIGYY
jgi:hypothetical protein